MTAYRSLFAFCACLVACKGSSERAAPEVPAEASAPASPPSARPAASAVSTSAPPDASAPARAAEPNLLDLVPSKVAVSSTVQNPRDFPEHLVDGRLDTAWNGKTGDLVGGWIAFRVPKDARVDRILLTVGYDKVKGALDLFTANHRITKVALHRDGAKISEHALDPNVRGLQSIPVSGPGGDYQIKVLATLGGSKPEWKELVVSELRVVGTPGKTKRTAKEPVRVVVGSLDAVPPSIEIEDVSASVVGPVPGIAELCTSVLASIDARKKELEETAKFHELTLHSPSCAETPLKNAFTADATFKRVRALRVSDGISTYSQLAVELPRGLALLPVTWAWDDPLDPGCPSIVRVKGLKGVRVENGHFLAVTDGDRTFFDDQGQPYAGAMIGAVWCTEKSAKLVCRAYDPQYKGSLGAFAIAPDGTLRIQD